MKLQKLMEKVPYVLLGKRISLEEVEISGMTCNSKEAGEGDIFVCIRGNRSDGHDYIEEAWKRGSEICVVEHLVREGKLLCFPKEMSVLLVADSKAAYAQMAAAYFGYPAEKLKLIGVTGTKGKTTVTSLIYGMLRNAGRKSGLIGTLGIQIGEFQTEIKNTTPDAFTIHKYFAKMVEMGCEYAVMEVSSQSIKEKRVEGLFFEVAVFTNFAQDHIGPGEHKNMREYRYYKSRLFQKAQIAIGNLDDIECEYMFRRTECRKYGFTCLEKKEKNSSQEYLHVMRAENIRYLLKDGAMVTHFDVAGETYELNLPGLFNVYNALAALFTLQLLEVEISSQKEWMSQVKVNGRMQRVFNDKNIACYIDYAHNAFGLEQVLKTLRQYEPERIILVFGCGGGRSRSRRTEMGRVAGNYADVTVLTSDNPRYENPWDILKDIESGICQTRGKYRMMEDRREAIAYAVSIAREKDVVLIAGKGHETYQEIAGIRYPMSDYQMVLDACRE